MLKAIQKFLVISLSIVAGFYLLYQGFLYSRAQRLLPAGTTIAGLDVSQKSPEDTAVFLAEHFLSPLTIYHRQERIELSPVEVGFVLDTERMIQEAVNQKADIDFWQGYFEFLVGRSLEPLNIKLLATHNRLLLLEQLEMIASFLDEPAKGPQLLSNAATFQYGEPGIVTNIEASLPLVEAVLYQPTLRQVNLIIEPQEAPKLDMAFLESAIRQELETFDGLGSIFVLDLQSGEEVNINADVAISGLSVLKIAVFLEAYRALDNPPDEYVEGLFYDTAVNSSNYGANLLLHVIAGQDNTYRGADLLTASMQRLGLVNTFMAVPYDAVAVASRPSTYVTPANSQTDLLTLPDPARQTTAEEMGTLLSMIYHCAQGGGPLPVIYPGEITSQECQAIIDLMTLNLEGNLIRFGVPDGIPVSHKHGWDNQTHGDAGIVFSESGDYVLVEYLHKPTDWLVTDLTFPILREISRATYNYFNFDKPFTGNTLRESNQLINLNIGPAKDFEDEPDQVRP